jgi:predicted RNA-binding protein (virulence factor B family)
VDTTPFGAFLEWGLEKHLLVPKREMQEEMQVGKKYVVKIVLDHLTNRILGVAKLNAFIFDNAKYERGTEVEGLVVSQTSLGYKILVDFKYWGLLYGNEVFKNINQGDAIKCCVRKVREDGKLDLSVRNPGKETQQNDSNKILELLKINGGKMNVSDKSDPELIRETFGLSKKTFKKALGTLFRQKLILIEPKSISII